jgi:hypothetical protein
MKEGLLIKITLEVIFTQASDSSILTKYVLSYCLLGWLAGQWRSILTKCRKMESLTQLLA